MRWRGRLFIKIFVGFWLVTTAVLASWMLTAEYFDARPDVTRTEPRHPGPPPRFVLRVIYSLQHLDDAALHSLLQRTEAEHGVEIFLLDGDGADLYDRPVPPDVLQVADELKGGRRRAFERVHRKPLLAHSVYREEQGLLRAVFRFPSPRHGLIGILGKNLWLRIGLAVLISGVVCYLLSLLMTNRLKAVQAASRRLANGDLDTRLNVRQLGGDETDELARDFNSMAEQLQDRMQSQRRLLADVSHELRSPLARLRIALALAQEDREKSDEYLLRIEHESERLEDLIGQLLSTQENELSLDAHIDLVELLQQLVEDANFEGKSRGKRVLFQHALQHAIVATSGDLLHKSFENILRNAVRHTADNSQVSVTLDRTGDDYLVSVTDQGPGVPAAELQDIFTEFYRVDTARARETGGYGLGLAIAKRAIERHRGHIEARDTGSGLAVTVRLPGDDA